MTGGEIPPAAESPPPPQGTEVVVGLIASPGPATELAQTTAGGLPDLLAQQLPGINWTVRVVTDRLGGTPAELAQLVDAGRRRLLGEGWQLAICLTDLPLRAARRPVVAHASASHNVAVLSMPALGPVSMSRRASQAMVRLVATLLGNPGAEGAEAAGPQAAGPATAGRVGRSPGRRSAREARELRARVRPDQHGIGLVAGVVTGNVRLLLGMLRANRPWRLALRLSRLLVAAFATGVFALVTVDIWELADALGPTRMVLLAVGSVVVVVLTIVLGAGLWERAPPGSGAREQVILFNVVTVLTVVLGVLALYLALWALTVVGSLLLVPQGLLADKVSHPVGVVDQIMLGWLASSLATAGGALGVALESDESVREAAYDYQPGGELPDHDRAEETGRATPDQD